jgi:RNA polymerase sigma-70 factor (ECF subfamily)
MDSATETFRRLRPRLQSIAYRMLGSAADAEEVVQEVWLRWNEVAHATLDSPEAWLVTVATRLSIDRLRASKAEREHYIGTWLPEPVLTESALGPEQTLERAGEISLALLMLLERLAPEARAAFLLREVFDADYAEVARIVGKTEVACRQMVHRAKLQLRDERPRFAVSRDAHRRLLTRFAEALRQGDFASMTSMLADDVELVGDGGGKVPSFGRPLVGGRRVAQLYYAVSRRAGSALRVELADINGQLGMLRFIEGVIESVQWFETDAERIVRVHSQRNPQKLSSFVTSRRFDSSLKG